MWEGRPRSEEPTDRRSRAGLNAADGLERYARASAVHAGVAEPRVQQREDVDRVAAGVDRRVDRDLDRVAGDEARRLGGMAVGSRVGEGGSGPTECQDGAGNDSSALLHEFSLLCGHAPTTAETERAQLERLAH